MKRNFFLLLISILGISLAACGINSQEQNTEQSFDAQSGVADTENPETEEPSTEASASPEILRFVDAWDEWHEVEILSNVEKHSYNWDYLTNDENHISYVGDENYTYRLGVDVSKWQGNVDWEKVKAEGYEFVIIRLGYRGYSEAGGIEIDEKFHQNIEGAQAAGLDVGVYFFSQAVNEEEALEEAAFVIDALEGYELQLPVVYDPELIRGEEARTNDVTGEQFTKNTIVFCEAMEEAGYSPMIYSNMIWEAFLFDMTQLQEYPFWYADYEPVPQTPYDFSIWQYSETGKVDGIEGNVDLNIMFEPIED